MKEIPLTQGKVALVDDQDFDHLNRFKWYAQRKGSGNWCAARSIHQVGQNRHQNILMHQEILGVRGVDHRDGNGLNNQRANIRPATQTQNNRNLRKHKDNSIGYKGVSKGRHGGFVARICCGRKIHLGTFQTAIEAAATYDHAALEHFGEFARTNFPFVYA